MDEITGGIISSAATTQKVTTMVKTVASKVVKNRLSLTHALSLDETKDVSHKINQKIGIRLKGQRQA
jgi:hypothetical protein